MENLPKHAWILCVRHNLLLAELCALRARCLLFQMLSIIVSTPSGSFKADRLYLFSFVIIYFSSLPPPFFNLHLFCYLYFFSKFFSFLLICITLLVPVMHMLRISCHFIIHIVLRWWASVVCVRAGVLLMESSKQNNLHFRNILIIIPSNVCIINA